MKNFILVHYVKPFFAQYEINKHKLFPKIKPDEEIHNKLLIACSNRIKVLYPDANVHIISNVEQFIPNTIFHVFKSLPLNHTAKF